MGAWPRAIVVLAGFAALAAPGAPAKPAQPRARVLKGHTAPVRGLLFLPDGRLLSNGMDRVLNVWDVQTGKVVRSLPWRFRGSVKIPGNFSTCRLALSPDGGTLAAISELSTLHLWNTADWSPVLWDEKTENGTSYGGDRYEAIVFARDGKTLGTTVGGGRAALWELASGRRLREWTASAGGVVTRAVAYSPDGLLVTGGCEGSAKWWDEDGKLKYALKLAPQWKSGSTCVDALALSPNGRLLAGAGNADARAVVRIWSLPSRKTAWTSWWWAAGGAHCVAFSPDGKTVAVGDGAVRDRPKGGSDPIGEIRLWDALSGKLRQVLRGHRGTVWYLAFSPDGKVLASASDDRTVRLWRLTPPAVSARTDASKRGPKRMD